MGISPMAACAVCLLFFRRSPVNLLCVAHGLVQSILTLTVQMLPVTRVSPVGSYLPVFVGISEPRTFPKLFIDDASA